MQDEKTLTGVAIKAEHELSFNSTHKTVFISQYRRFRLEQQDSFWSEYTPLCSPDHHVNDTSIKVLQLPTYQHQS